MESIHTALICCLSADTTGRQLPLRIHAKVIKAQAGRVLKAPGLPALNCLISGAKSWENIYSNRLVCGEKFGYTANRNQSPTRLTPSPEYRDFKAGGTRCLLLMRESRGE